MNTLKVLRLNYLGRVDTMGEAHLVTSQSLSIQLRATIQ
jgi:hypothetical protein